MASPLNKAAVIFLQDTSDKNAAEEFMSALTSCVQLLPDNRLDDYPTILSENSIILEMFGRIYFDHAYQLLQRLPQEPGQPFSVGCLGDARLLVQALKTHDHGLLWLVTSFLSLIVAIGDPRRNVATMKTMQEFVLVGGVSSLFELLATTDQWAPGGGAIQKKQKKGKLSKSRRNKLTAITIENLLNITANLVTRVSGSSRLVRKCTFAKGAVSCALSMLASTEEIDDGWKPSFVRSPASLFLLNFQQCVRTKNSTLVLFQCCPIEELISQLVSNVLIEGRFKKTLRRMDATTLSNPEVLQHTLALICNLCTFPIQDVVRNYIVSSDLTIKQLFQSTSLLIRSYNAKNPLHGKLLTIVAYGCEVLSKICCIAAKEKKQASAVGGNFTTRVNAGENPFFVVLTPQSSPSSTPLPSLYTFIIEHFLSLPPNQFLRMYALIRHDNKNVAAGAACLISGLSQFESNEIDSLLLGSKTLATQKRDIRFTGLCVNAKAERKLISLALKFGYSKEGKSIDSQISKKGFEELSPEAQTNIFDSIHYPHDGAIIIEECFNPKCSRESRAEAWLLSPAGAGWDPKKINQRVVIRNLISRPELNGMDAVSLALKLDEKGSFEDRVTVMVTRGDRKKQKFNLKPACLMPDLAFNSRNNPVIQRRDFQKCSRCKTAQYCSRVCQTAHWCVHKKLCKKKSKNSKQPSP